MYYVAMYTYIPVAMYLCTYIEISHTDYVRIYIYLHTSLLTITLIVEMCRHLSICCPLHSPKNVAIRHLF